MPISKFKVVVFYGVLSLVSLLWALLQDRNLFFIADAPQIGDLASAALGMGVGLLAVGSFRLASLKLKWAQEMELEFKSMLGQLTATDALVFALCSGVAEEMFFRGAMQQSLGLIPTSLLFGILHMGPNRRFLPWPFMAAGMGLAFGLLFNFTGNLLAPIVAHFTINFFNINRFRQSSTSVEKGLKMT